MIVESAFDGADWEELAPAGSFVERTASMVRVRAVPSVDVYVDGDLHTASQTPIAGASLTVVVDGAIVSVSGAVGIAWRNEGGDDAYRLEVADGNLQARRITAAGGEREVCTDACPEYSSLAYSRLRLLEQEGSVLYQAASEAGDWVDIGSAPASDLPYAVVVYAGATGPGSGDITVIDAEWRACAE